ncbi:MAG: spore coat protein [Bacillota bacterium]
MNKFGMREAVEMFEMLRDSACMIDHYTDYINHCQDPALRQILESQQRHMVEEYQRKISVMQQHGIDLTNVPRIQSAVAVQQGGAAAGMAGMQGVSGMAGIQGTAGLAGIQGTSGMAGVTGGTNIQFGMHQPGQAQTQQQPGQAQTQWQAASRTLNDRTIAQGALIFHRCGAMRATIAALESAEPHLRNLAANSARTCMDMAYEIFRYMEPRGFYQMPEVPKNFVSHMQYQGTQVYPGMQQGYQAGAQGNIPGQIS